MRAPLPYRALARLLSPPLILFTIWIAIRTCSLRYLRQRLGMGFPRRGDKPVWFHCASVGEVRAATPLINAWRERCPEQGMIISTITPTGARTALEQLPANINHVYLPIDWPGAVQRFLKAIAPGCAIILETEIWPDLYAACATRNIPLAIVNGRLSERTMQTHAWLHNVYAQTLKHAKTILTRSESDSEKFRALGAPANAVITVGNIKFANAASHHEQNELPDLVGRRYWLAASTHDDEELRLAELHRQLEVSGLLLVIAPRHPQRKKAIIRQLAALNLNIAIRSEGARITDNTDIYLADTLGEMNSLMSYADFVFMGGSLVPVGGHNVLEPARMGKAILSGPHTKNIASEIESLESVGGLLLAENETQLLEIARALLGDSEYRKKTGENARRFTNAQDNIPEVYLQHLEKQGFI